MSEVAGLVLAAGAGTRFGGPKAVVELAGERLVDRAVRVLREGGVSRTYVVGGAVALEVVGASVVTNPDWATGMGSSLRVGLAAMTGDVEAALVLLVDQVGLTSAAVSRVLAAGADPDRLATATYDGRRGHPVLIGRAHWREVTATAVGDVGAREMLAANSDRVVTVECGDVATDVDVDRPEDLPIR
jgi:CTP:molybdopterin cytidylyltransferase MocA